MQKSSEFIEIDSIDKEIILLLTRGCTSSYSVWATMADQAKKNLRSKKVLAYKNIHKRTINLEKLGFIEKTKLDTINIHGRLDYKVTLKGIEQLVPYILMDSDETKNIVQYMNKFKLNKRAFGNMVSQIVVSMMKSTKLYLGSTTYDDPLPMDTIQIENILRTNVDLNAKTQMIQRTILTNPRLNKSAILQQAFDEARERGDRVIVNNVTLSKSGYKSKRLTPNQSSMIEEPKIANDGQIEMKLNQIESIKAEELENSFRRNKSKLKVESQQQPQKRKH